MLSVILSEAKDPCPDGGPEDTEGKGSLVAPLPSSLALLRTCLRMTSLGMTAMLLASAALAQQPPDTSRCDSIVGAARVDSVEIGMFISVIRRDGDVLPLGQAGFLSATIVSTFIPPRPFRMTVFAGPPRMRSLRRMGADTVTELRAPTVTGVYRTLSTSDNGLQHIDIVRESLMPGFDSAATMAIRAVAADRELFLPPDDDSMRVDIRLSTDSTASARRFLSTRFPRMPVVDVSPARDNPPPAFPDDAKKAGFTAGEVVLRFVIDRTGRPVAGTVELIRATSESFLKSALNALSAQRFAPATIRGCPVAQVIDYPFTFLSPSGKATPRH